MDAGKWRSRGYDALTRENGRTLDQAREIAEEAGYIGRAGDYQTTTVDDLLQAMREELAGQPIYSREQDRLVQLNAAYDDTVRGREAYRRLVEEVDAAVGEFGLDRVDDRVLVRATELVNDDTDVATALERALDEDYRTNALAERGGEADGDSDIPFFEDAGASPDAGRPAGEARAGAAGRGGGIEAAGERLPGAGGDEGAASQSLAPAGELPEPGTPQAEEISELALREAGGRYSLTPSTHEAMGIPTPKAGKDDRVYAITLNGETVGWANIRVNGDTAEVRDIYSITGDISTLGRNSLGPGAVRSLLGQFLQENPEVKTFMGERVSGARMGGAHHLAGEGVDVSVTPKRGQGAGEAKIAEPKPVTDPWDAMPAATTAEGKVLYATYETMIEDAERSDFYAGIIQSCRD